MNTEFKRRKEQLEAELAQIEQAEKAQQESEKQEYLVKKSMLVKNLCTEAQAIAELIKEFREKLETGCNELHSMITHYGEIHSLSQGGFSVKSEDQQYKIQRKISKKPLWDERSEKGIALIKDFLISEVKSSNPKVYDLLLSFISKDKEGNLEYAKVMEFMKHEKHYDDERWKEGLRLLKEGSGLEFVKYQFLLYTKETGESWQNIPLSLNAL